MANRYGFWPRLALLLSLAAPAAWADPAEQGAAQCESAIAHGARMTGVPQEVLHAISLTETGRRQGGRLRPWPWAINREGKGHWFKSREEALAFARQSVADGRPSFDVGCFQINYFWHGDKFPSLEAMFDMEASARYAGQFLRALHAETGNWSAAAGAYHSRTPHYAGIYRARFDHILAGLGAAPVVLAEAAPVEAAAAPRRVRTRMTRGPLIIRIERGPAATAPGANGERTATVRAERHDKILVTDAGPGDAGAAAPAPSSRAF